MPIINRIGEFHSDMQNWRQHLHQTPEILFDLFETSKFVEARLREFGITQIETGIAKTGIVAVIEGKGEGPVIGLRADMDALPMTEETGLPYASKNQGAMHACGHDGHTTMLLGAAKYLNETRNFNGRAVLIFQPAEEGGGGGRVMCEEGLIERYSIEELYALHNLPGLAIGEFETCVGPIMAAVDTLTVTLKGKGAHAAYPHEGVDPVLAVASLCQNLQSIISRNLDPMEKAVISVTQIHTGTASNVIPNEAMLQATIRSFDRDVREMLLKRISTLTEMTASAFDVTVDYVIDDGYPATINEARSTNYAIKVAKNLVGEDKVNENARASMGAEDFSFMLQHRQGAYIFIGNGESEMLHNTGYNFNDEASIYGASFFAKLIEEGGAGAHHG